MTRLVFVLVLGALLAQSPAFTGSPLCLMAQHQQTAMAQQGNPEHKEPPPGWYCSRDAQDAAKACACHRIDASPDCEGIPHEDAACKVYCFKQHCHCPVRCVPNGGPGPTAPEED